MTTERLSLRINKKTKEVLQLAANTMSMTLTDFVIHYSVKAAQDYLKEIGEIK